ncbi:glycosyltransferase family 4 protein [Cohnella ginsengisoli]|uniref:glycosyltransferase family 4 protein n=1 Tax=Cohnella ginsengisoli TaxID=425004 RepID=UPI0024066DCC|nr:glycosyltransferase family 4 protein [Cohnella ginsengisoli]
MPHIGGVDLYVRQLKNGLERRGHKVDILSRLPDGSGYSLLNKGAAVLRSAIHPLVEANAKGYFEDHIPDLDPLIQELEIERYAYELGAAYFDVGSYDLIHAQDIISAKALSRIKKPDTALVTTIHGYWAGEWFLTLREQRMLDDPARRERLWQYAGFREQSGLIPADAATLPTNWMRDIMSNDFAVPLEKLTVVPNGIDIGDFMKRMNAGTTFRCPHDKKSDYLFGET